MFRMTERQKFREVLFEIELRKRKKVQEFLVKMGLTPGQGQARILSYLSVNDRVTQRETADACLLDATTMSRALDRLRKNGPYPQRKRIRDAAVHTGSDLRMPAGRRQMK